jgi:prepilin-type N-terminal cleavage/methylation domain-containing protein
MQSTLVAAFPSRHTGFSLVEVAVAIALLGIATAFSLPRFNHPANHAPPSERIAPCPTPNNTDRTASSQHWMGGADFPSGNAKGKILKFMHGYPGPSPSGGIVVIDWGGGFAADADASLRTIAKPDAASGDKCQVTYHSTQTPGGATTPRNLDANGC